MQSSCAIHPRQAATNSKASQERRIFSAYKLSNQESKFIHVRVPMAPQGRHRGENFVAKNVLPIHERKSRSREVRADTS